MYSTYKYGCSWRKACIVQRGVVEHFAVLSIELRTHLETTHPECTARDVSLTRESFTNYKLSGPVNHSILQCVNALNLPGETTATCSWYERTFDGRAGEKRTGRLSWWEKLWADKDHDMVKRFHHVIGLSFHIDVSVSVLAAFRVFVIATTITMRILQTTQRVQELKMQLAPTWPLVT